MNAKLQMLEDINVEWQKCQRCSLGRMAVKRVIYEEINFHTNTPVEAMFIGEGPGRAENVLGRPFVGPAGSELRKVLALEELNQKHVVLANLLVCRPQDRKNGNDVSPEEDWVRACAPHLSQLIYVFNPKAIVALGNIPQQYIGDIAAEVNWTGTLHCLYHPSFVARSNNDRVRSRWQKAILGVFR